MDKDVSFITFESVCARLERTIRRLWILAILLTVLLVGSNCAWIWYERQFEEVTSTEVTQEVESDDSENVIVSGTGDISYGNESDTDS